jgi:hypothetical protein
MSDEATDVMSRFRAEAAARGLAAVDVEDWIRAARPAVYLGEGDEGPVAARLGGNPMLPEGAQEPSCGFVAAIDCALIPPDATGLPLPPDGQLLLFAAASVLGGARSVSSDGVVYVPAGTPTTGRSFDGTWRDFYPQRQLRTLWRQLSWSDGEGDYDEDDEEDEWRDVTGELGGVWSDVTGRPPAWAWRLQLGGHPVTRNYPPGEGPGGDWVLLATWNCGDDVKELDGGLVHWVVRRKDLADLRFEETYVTVDMG